MIYPSSKFICGINQTSNHSKIKHRNPATYHMYSYSNCQGSIGLLKNHGPNDQHGPHSWYNINQTHLRNLASTEIVTKSILFCHNLKFAIPCSLSECHMEKKQHFKWISKELHWTGIQKTSQNH